MDLKEALNSVHDTISFDSKDWGADKRHAWIYGVIVGWDDASYKELSIKFGWNETDIARNKRHYESIKLVKDEMI